jgi:hypothetical protein
MAKGSKTYTDTPDGRYYISGSRLWRNVNPDIDEATRASLITELMAARRAVRNARGNAEAAKAAKIHATSVTEALGQSGDVWWTDGAPDYHRMLIENTPYKDWWLNIKS